MSIFTRHFLPTIFHKMLKKKKIQAKSYYGISETKFKTRHSNHLKSFNNEKYKDDTQLLNELWKIKNSKQKSVLVWEILAQCKPNIVNMKRCLLCLNEKLQIALHNK